jgi:effector-binding domain-containing protein
MTLSEPVVLERSAVTYLGIGVRAPMSRLGEVLPPLFPEVFGWLGEHGIAPAGAPFVRYLTVDMDAELEMEVGVPVAPEAAGHADDRVRRGVLPAGRYASLVQIGPPDQAAVGNAALQNWMDQQHLTPSVEGGRWGGRLEFSLLSPDEQPDVNLWETEIACLLM